MVVAAVAGLAAAGVIAALLVGLLGSSSPPARRAAAAALTARPPALGRRVVDRALGARVALPRGWSARRAAGALILRSADRSAQLVVSARSPALAPRATLTATLAGLRRAERRLRAGPLSTQRLAGRPAVARFVAAVNASGTPVRAIVAATRAGRRTYVVEVLTARDAPAARLVEGQQALNSLALVAPHANSLVPGRP